jgi:hypothetical protein
MFPKYTRRLNGNRTRVSADHENIPWGFRAIDFLRLAEGREQTKRRSVQASPQDYAH